jgi:hypothetical protein
MLPPPSVKLARKLRMALSNDMTEASEEEIEAYAVQLAEDFKKEVTLDEWSGFFRGIIERVRDYDREGHERRARFSNISPGIGNRKDDV